MRLISIENGIMCNSGDQAQHNKNFANQVILLYRETQGPDQYWPLFHKNHRNK